MKKILAIVASFALPTLALAQQFNSSPDAFWIIEQVRSILSYVIPLLITLGVIYFIYGVIQYIGGKTEDVKKAGRDTMIYGIIGLFVVISIWGLVGIIGNTFGIDAGGQLDNSQIPSVE